MSTTVELNATEIATRLLPLMKEYAEKMEELGDRVQSAFGQLFTMPAKIFDPLAIAVGRVICLHDSLAKPVSDLAREASGLIEHASLEYHLKAELKLRLDELEEHIRYTELEIGELVQLLTSRKNQAELVRKFIEKSGRYKAPF